MPIELVDIGRLFAAVVCGAIVGFERELHDKPAGFRTNIMICLGAALFTLLSIRTAEAGGFSDRTRIAAQVVTGVGFLGAGAIIQFRGNVIGLTTAATIWTVASVGMALGAGEFVLGFVATFLATAVLFGLEALERYIARWRTTTHLELEIEPSLEVAERVERTVRKSTVHCKTWVIAKAAEGITIHATLVGPVGRLEHLQGELIAQGDIRSLRRL
ncbi:MAG: MgtC/SapB family protein [Planctomycetes bacterium]|nr:MgtC/SapB family protein [Planctomycetota bacterium]